MGLLQFFNPRFVFLKFPVQRAIVQNSIFQFSQFPFQTSRQNCQSHHFNQSNVFLFDVVQFRMGMIHTQRMLLRSDVISEHQIQFVISIPAAGNGRNCVVGNTLGFRKDKGRQTRARDLGYNLSPDMTREKVKTLLSSNHSDRMYFRGNKAKKKMGKPITTKTALDLVEQMKWEAEMDREAERKEAERQFMLDELASTTDDLNRLKEREADAKKAISELIAIIYEANNKLQDYQVKMNGLRAGKSYLEDEIRKLEEALKQ